MLSDAPLSRAFNGQVFPLPRDAEEAEAFAGLQRRAEEARTGGMQVVAVQGLGFVGSVMAAVVAHARNEAGVPRYFVIGVDLPTPEAYWKVAMLNQGDAPVVSEDAAVSRYVKEAVRDHRNLAATTDARAYGLADIVVVDVNFDVGGMDSFKAAIRSVACNIAPDCLVLVETTVPPGTTSRIVLPMLREGLARRGTSAEPLVAHSFERVMPGRNYIASIERFWRSYAAESDAAAERAGAFLSSIVATDEFPLRRLASTTATELAKVLENSYRATNIAFIHEWTRAAEQVGVNLFEVIGSIAVRKGTHDNIRQPGFGVGGYCLTKDSNLAQWGLAELLGSDVELGMTLAALAINDEMPRHSYDLLRHAIGGVDGRTVLVAGISYLHDVGDTRNSPSALFCDLLTQDGATVVVHDPYVSYWPERTQYPHATFAEAVSTADAIALCSRHQAYLELDASALIGPSVRCVLDTQDIVSDSTAEVLWAAGIQPVGVGKGHWRPRFPTRADR